MAKFELTVRFKDKRPKHVEIVETEPMGKGRIPSFTYDFGDEVYSFTVRRLTEDEPNGVSEVRE